MRAVWVIGYNTFREIMRDRILYSLIIFAVFIMGLSLALGQLSFSEQTRITTNFGFSAISLSMVILAIFVGASLVFKEIEKRTVLTLLARPISRIQFVVGKFMGLTMVMFTITIGLSLLLCLILYGYGVTWNRDFTIALLGIFLEAEILLSLTLLFSSLSKPTLTVSFSISFFFIGHWLDSLTFFAEKSESSFFQAVSKFVNYILPNLDRFNWRSYAVTDQSIESMALLSHSLHAFFWIGLLLSLTGLVFRRKDFV